MTRPRVAVIGAGWSGLSAAVTLAPQVDVTVYEAGRMPGGRARRLGDDARIDNGQHILIGAYRTCLAMMRTVGVDPAQVLASSPLVWHQAGGLSLRCPDWPAPWHLLAGLATARGVSATGRWRLLRALIRLRLDGWRTRDITVACWLAETGQTGDVVRDFWGPLVLSALNTPVERASMRTLAAVLRDSLGGSAADATLLLPKTDLSRLFPEPACAWLARQGARLVFGHRVDAVAPSPSGVRVGEAVYDRVILATAPYHLARLLPPGRVPEAVKLLAHVPIYTAYLEFDHAPRLPAAMTGTGAGPVHWLFGRDGMVAAVASAAEGLDRQAVQQAAEAAVRRLDPAVGALVRARVVCERRATFAAEPGRVPPGLHDCGEGILLAGDWLDADYPATLESAARSGVAAARAVLDEWKTKS